MNLLEAAVLGIVQGLTEFLPISSTAHLRIAPEVFGWDDPGAAFAAVIQLGTMLAVVLYFRHELWAITRAWLRGIADPAARGTRDYRMGWYLVLATVPVGACGLVFSDQIETGARNLWVIAAALLVGAMLLGIAERAGRRERAEDEITRRDAVVVGLAQALALIPGSSRSGVTITAGLFAGLQREAAARFSFLLSVPAIVLSGLYEARHVGDADGPPVRYTLVALACAFVVGWASIAWLMAFISRHSTFVFIYYRIGLAFLIIGLLCSGVWDASN